MVRKRGDFTSDHLILKCEACAGTRSHSSCSASVEGGADNDVDATTVDQIVDEQDVDLRAVGQVAISSRRYAALLCFMVVLDRWDTLHLIGTAARI